MGVTLSGAAAQPAGSAPESKREAIARLLRARARAVMEGDKDAFMATVADAQPTFRASQSATFDRMRTVPLGRYRLRARWDHLGDMVRPSDFEEYVTAHDVALPVTEERYRIRGFDRQDAVENLFLTFVQEDGGWKIASDSDLTDLGLYGARHMWEFGPVYKIRRGPFLLMGHPCGRGGAPPGDCRRVPASFLDLARRALQRVERYWPGARRRIVILVPGTEDELSAILQATFDTGDFVAFAYSTIDPDDGVDFTAPRVVFNQRALDTRSPSDVVYILAHELLHVVTRRASGPFVPIFVEEGFADYVGRDADASALHFLHGEIALGTFDRRLPENFEFTAGDGTSIFRSYQESHSAVRFFVQRWGLRPWLKFYRRLGDRRVAFGTTRYHVDDVMKATIGVGLRRFQGLWADSIGSR